MRLFRRKGGFVIALLFMLIGAAFLTQVVPYRQILDSHQRVDSARSQLAALEADNKRLAADVAALETDSEVEKLAREKLGYVRPGETAYVVVDPPDTGAVVEEELKEDEIEDVRTWVDKIWDFLTGGNTGSHDEPDG